MKIKTGKSFLIINRVIDKINFLEKEYSASPDIILAGVISYDEDLIKAGMENKSIEKWREDGKAVTESFDIFRRIICP
jgi:CO dehydrogenase nickel-insertion accessory protein CooC1